MPRTFLNGKWLFRGSAALIEYSPVFGSYPGLQLYSTWHCPHWSFASYFSSSAILRKPPRNSRTSNFVALGSLCHSVSFSGRESAWISPSRTIRGFAAWGSWQKKQLSALFRSFTNSTTLEPRSHFAFSSLSPRYFHLRIWSCVLHWRHVGLAAAALSGMNALCSFESGYRSSRRSHALRTPVFETYPQPSFDWNRPPYARSTIRWSTSMKEWLRGDACSLVKPCPIMSLSQNGFGDRSVRRDFSTRAGFLKFRVPKLSYWSLWQPPHASRSTRVVGLSSLSSRCAVVLEWQLTQLMSLCFPAVLSALISSWQSKHFSSLTGAPALTACFFSGASFAAGFPPGAKQTRAPRKPTNSS